MLKTLERLPPAIPVEEEAGLFDKPDDTLRQLAERLAAEILAESGLPLKAIKVTKADLPPEDQDEDNPEIVFRLWLACGPREAFQWLEKLGKRQWQLATGLGEQERWLFNHTFRIVPYWE